MQVLYNFCKIISLIIRGNSRRAVLFQWLWKWQNKIILEYMTLISAALSLISSHNAQILGNKKAGAKNARRNSSPWLWHCRKTRNLFSKKINFKIKKVFEIWFDLTKKTDCLESDLWNVAESAAFQTPNSGFGKRPKK